LQALESEDALLFKRGLEVDLVGRQVRAMVVQQRHALLAVQYT